MLKSEIRRVREQEILSKLDKFGILTVDHLRKMNVAGLGKSGRRNCLRILNEMESKGLVRSKKVGMKLFAVNGKGFGHWEHTLLRNDFLVREGHWRNCKIEVPVKRNGKVELVADAVIRGDICVEVDRMQKRSVNREKVKKYQELGVKVMAVCYRSRVDHWKGVPVSVVEDWK